AREESKIAVTAQVGMVKYHPQFPESLGEALVGLDREEAALAVFQLERIFWLGAFGDNVDDAANGIAAELAGGPTAQYLDPVNGAERDGREIHRTALRRVELNPIEVNRDLFRGGTADADRGELAQASEALHMKANLLREQFGQGDKLLAVIVGPDQRDEGGGLVRALGLLPTADDKLTDLRRLGWLRGYRITEAGGQSRH